MEQIELNALLAQLQAELDSISIPLSPHTEPILHINTRAKRRLGCCYFDGRIYRIEISAMILGNSQLLKETIIHELLHTCPGCRNHGQHWKELANTVNSRLGYHVQRTVPMQWEPSGPLRHEEVKYVLQCENCGAEIGRMRMSKAVKQPWRYRCPCGGKLKRIQ